jgi:hypothetical protein
VFWAVTPSTEPTLKPLSLSAYWADRTVLLSLAPILPACGALDKLFIPVPGIEVPAVPADPIEVELGEFGLGA